MKVAADGFVGSGFLRTDMVENNAAKFMKARFFEFLIDGVLGDLRCGMSKSDVRKAFGAPERWNGMPGPFRSGIVKDFVDSDGWYFDSFGVEFDSQLFDARIISILLCPSLENPVWYDDLFPKEGATFVEIKKLLYENFINFTEEGEIWGSNFKILVGQTRIIGFVDQDVLKARAKKLIGNEFEIRSQLKDSVSDTDKIVTLVIHEPGANK